MDFGGGHSSNSPAVTNFCPTAWNLDNDGYESNLSQYSPSGDSKLEAESRRVQMCTIWRAVVF